MDHFNQKCMRATEFELYELYPGVEAFLEWCLGSFRQIS